MEFLYVVDPSSSEPIMLLDNVIGHDSETGEGIPADRFCRELLFLDTLGKSKINIWVNSPGGSVVDGMQIFNTILKTKTKVDTHCVGMAASIAAPIFLAGRNRYMMDNAVIMVHPVSGGDEESRKVFEACVNTMISSRSFLTPERVKGLMDATTWMSAIDCENMELCQKEDSSQFNKQRAKPDLTNITEAHKFYKELTNKAINQNTNMEKVYNKLNLVKGTNEDAILASIEAIENKAKVAEATVAKIKNELSEKETELAKVKADFDKVSAEVKTAKESEEKAKTEKVANEAKTDIEAAVKVGKIKNEAKDIESWTKSYIANPESTKNMLESIPATKKAPVITTGGVPNEAALTNVIATSMAELRNQFKI